MAIIIDGNWKKGISLDVHTLESHYLGVDEYGHDRWDNIRSEIGELVYQLKYKENLSVLPKILEHIEKINGLETMDYIIPVPPSKNRKLQPVSLIAKKLSKKISVPVLEGIITKRKTRKELKDVENIEKRESLLRDSLEFAQDTDISGKNILLLDDLYRSGVTLRTITDILYKKVGVKDVYVLTMTKSRSKK